MKRSVATLLALIFTISTPLVSANAVIKPGSTCNKLGITKTDAGKKFTCVKSGKKLVWDKGVSISTPEPVAPTSWSDLYYKRDGVSYAAWKFFGAGKAPNPQGLPQLEYLTGPNTQPWSGNIEGAITAVLKSFPLAPAPMKSIVIYYNYSDLQWANDNLQALLTDADYQQLYRNENGKILESNCQDSEKTCRGSKQQTLPSGISVLLMGVPTKIDPNDPTGVARYTSGQLEAHEYFHALQREPIIGKSLGPSDWPPAWFREGSAEFVQNAAINAGDFGKYSEFRRSDSKGLYAQPQRYSESAISEFLDMKNSANDWANYDQYMNYNLGARIIEILVALKGQQSIIDLYATAGTGIGFEKSFEAVYGIAFSKAIPLIAKTLSAQISASR